MATPTPRMTRQQAPRCKIASTDNSMFAKRLERILRACRGVSATGRSERRDAILIETYQHNEREYGDALKYVRR